MIFFCWWSQKPIKRDKKCVWVPRNTLANQFVLFYLQFWWLQTMYTSVISTSCACPHARNILFYFCFILFDLGPGTPPPSSLCLSTAVSACCIPAQSRHSFCWRVGMGLNVAIQSDLLPQLSRLNFRDPLTAIALDLLTGMDDQLASYSFEKYIYI